MVSSPHGFIIHWIIILKNIKKVMKVIDVKNWGVDNSRVSKRIVSLVEWNSSVSSMKSSIQMDMLVDVAGYVYPMDFMILDIREDEKKPFILRTPFLTTAKAVIKFDKGTLTLRSGKSKISFHRILESLGKVEKGNNLYNRVHEVFQRKKKKIFSEARDGVRIYPDGVVSTATGKFENFQVIFDEKNLGSS
uniref:Reverse transcriptase domain-containing protein n=1 Tax=Tanacetum cinerariifolium TaxID=118510 RepID=A0A6L2JCN4_TANCI|nr:hypothetical protein [Tanacetum cinerariifolium]